MQATPFEAHVRPSDSGAVVELHGQIDRNAGEALAAAYDEARALTSGKVLLNFAAVDYINSTGIAHIVALLARARTEGRGVDACGLSAHYREIFEITRLSDFMTVYTDEAGALASTA